MWIIKDCCGFTCMIVSYFFIFAVDFSVCMLEYLAVPGSYCINVTLFNFLVLMIVWSHLKASFTNPGTIPRGYTQLDQDKLPLRLVYVLERISTQSKSGSENAGAGIPTPKRLLVHRRQFSRNTH